MKRLVIALALVLVAVLLTPPLEAQVEAYDLIIMNGRIVDGTGNPWFYGDVAIRADRIINGARMECGEGSVRSNEGIRCHVGQYTRGVGIGQRHYALWGRALGSEDRPCYSPSPPPRPVAEHS